MKLSFTILLLLSQSLICFANNENTHQLKFLENVGQVKDQNHKSRPDIDFKISSPGINVFIGDGQIHYQFYQSMNNRKGSDSVVRMYRMDVKLLGFNKNAKILKEKLGIFYERHSNVTANVTYSYSKITYKDIYPNIDWVLYIKDDRVEYDFVIHKGGNSANIQLQYEGSTGLAINDDGSFTATTPMGSVTESSPYTYHEDGKPITSSFMLKNNILSFKTASHTGELIIDPKLEWATYYGGEGIDYETEVACDDSGYIYIAGSTNSFNNIATVGSHQSTYGGGTYDSYLAKFTPSGERLWATYYGGNGMLNGERFVSLACDHYNNIYLVGTTESLSGISTPGSHQEVLSGGNDAFLVKFNSDGMRIWSTYYGGDSADIAQAVACDDSGNIVITGYTTSDNGISTPGSYQPLISLPFIFTEPEAFLAKFDSVGVLRWGTYFGGTGSELGYSVVTDQACNIYITGETSSTSNIATPGAHQSTFGGGILDAFLAKFSNSGERIWASYYGGNDYDNGSGIAVDGTNLYLSGDTQSPSQISSQGSFQPIHGGATDVYLVKFDTAGTRDWATYYGGTHHEANQQSLGHKLALDNSGNIFMAYATSSTTDISTIGAPQENYGGGQLQYDAFLVKFNGLGERQWATYFGGCSYEIVGSCATDDFGNVYISGLSGSDNMGTRGCYRDFKEAVWDSYLAKFSEGIHKLIGDTQVCVGSTAIYYASFVPGAESYTWTLPNGWIGTSTIDTISVIVGTTSGVVSVVANKDCSTEPVQDIFVTVHPLPVVNITLSGSVLSATSGFVSYQWYNATGEIAGATNQNYTVITPGEYYVVVVDTNGCSNESNVVPLGVDEITLSNNILLYPNPNNGNFSIRITGLNNAQNIDIEIFDITGRRVLSETHQIHNNALELSINMKDKLSQGQYTIKIRTDNERQVLKFLKLF